MLLAAASTALVALFIAVADANAQQARSESFTWSGDASDVSQVRIQNLNGSISVIFVSGSTVQVTAGKRWTRGTGSSVRIETKRDGRQLAVCGVWARQAPCGQSEDPSFPRGRRAEDATTIVDFVVRIPSGIPLVVGVANGDVAVENATSDVRARSLNGNVSVRTRRGELYASTINGTVIARLNDGESADVELRSQHGRMRSDFPIVVVGRLEPGVLRGRIARGGRAIRLSTVQGDVVLQRAQ